MAQSQPPPSRPSLPPAQTSFQRDYASPNGRPSPLGPQSPPMGLGYSSPSPSQFSPPQYGQPPAAKRPRLSPEAQSPFPAPSQPPTPVAQSTPTPTTPADQAMVNGAGPPASRTALMPPPQRPTEKSEDRNYEDILSGTGINIEEEARMLVRPDYYAPPPAPDSLKSQNGSFEYQKNSFGGSGAASSTPVDQVDGQSASPPPEPTAEEVKQREESRADWEASRHRQHPLWDMFLLGGALNDRIRNISITEHLVDPQSGVLVNTQKHAPPPSVRVNGLEGASRVIDKGQAILDTGAKAERLSDIMKIISLATKARLTGLVGASSRLALERRLHSKGNIPDEWHDLALPARTASVGPDGVPSPSGSTGLKRATPGALPSPRRADRAPGTHSQMTSEPSATEDPARARSSQVASTLEAASQVDRTAEDSRRQRRTKRRAAANAESAAAGTGPDTTPDAALAAVLEAEKKTTKKERKLAESKFSEQQQHKSANEAARMAVSGLLGSRFGGKKQRTYDWMNAGKGGPGGATATPGRPPGSGPASQTGTPAPDRHRAAAAKEKHFGQWDEEKDARIQARDVLLVLEADGRATRSYMRGLSVPENS